MPREIQEPIRRPDFFNPAGPIDHSRELSQQAQLNLLPSLAHLNKNKLQQTQGRLPLENTSPVVKEIGSTNAIADLPLQNLQLHLPTSMAQQPHGQARTQGPHGYLSKQ